MTKKQIYNALTNTSTMVDLTTEEQTSYDNAISLHNSDPKNNTLNIALEELRFERNQLISETDYLALPDVVMSEDMTTYRQALRDITNGLTTVEQVEAVVFPTKPV